MLVHGLVAGKAFHWDHEDGCRNQGPSPLPHSTRVSQKNKCFANSLSLLDAESISTKVGERMASKGGCQDKGLLCMFAGDNFVEGSLCERVNGMKKDGELRAESASSDSWESFLSMFASEESIHGNLCDSEGEMETFRNKQEYNNRMQMPVSSRTSKIGEHRKPCDWDSLTIEEAFEQMGSFCLNEESLERCVSLIQKCKQGGCAANAIRVYAHLCDNGLDCHGLLGSYLVAMFVQSWSMTMAEQIFNRLLFCNHYSWTHLMQGYFEGGACEQVLHLFGQMKEYGIHPNDFTFVLVLRACTVLKLVRIGQKIHSEIIMSLKGSVWVTRALLEFYVKCDLFAEADEVFNDLCRQEVDHEENLSQAYTSHEDFDDCSSFVHYLPSKGPVFALKAFTTMRDLVRGHELHIQIVKTGLEQDYFISNTLIDMYAKFGLLLDAWNTLSSMSKRDVVSWTALIAGCIDNDLCDSAWIYLEMMEKEGIPLNVFTLASCLKGCTILQSLNIGRKLHSQIMKEGLYSDFVIGNSLVNMYAKCGSLDEARDVFDKFARQDIISWTSLISGYTDYGLYKEAKDCFTRMISAGVHPNNITYCCCLKACAFTLDLQMGCRLHKDIVVEELEKDILIGNALVHVYAKLGLFPDAKEVLDDLSNRDVISWTTMISELVEDGQGAGALKMFEQMCKQGLSPSHYTYVCGLKACVITKKIEQGRIFHNEIVKRGLEKMTVINEALINMYGVCGKPITLQQPE